MAATLWLKYFFFQLRCSLSNIHYLHHNTPFLTDSPGSPSHFTRNVCPYTVEYLFYL